MASRVCLAFLVILLSVSGVRAQESWSGNWVQSDGSQGGRLEFTFSQDGTMNGNITNNGVVGLWTGFVRNDGAMFADYAYPTTGFSANAVGRILNQQGNVVYGHMVFVGNNQIFSEADFALGLRGAPQGAMGGVYPFTGDGLFVYCGAASVCGQRGVNTLPGNWSWTSGLFGDLKKSYPQVWCNLFPGSC
jgi:hypothetical protein